MTPEQRLYAECINRHVMAAIWPFKIPYETTPSLEKQYEMLSNRKRPVIFYGHTRMHAYESMLWLESSNFDKFADEADLGGNYVQKVFDFVQKCVTLRKKLLGGKNEQQNT